MVLIDNGHGAETPGKRSPDGLLREYSYARRLARTVLLRLRAAGIEAELLTPEENDVSLAERCRRANGVCRRLGHDNVVLLSLHLNAAGDGSRWMNARGWEAWTSRGRTAADAVADRLYREAARLLPVGIPLRCDRTDGDDDKEAGFYLLTHTLCPAVLTENLFQDNRDDVAWLRSDEGFETLVQLHVNAIMNS